LQSYTAAAQYDQNESLLTNQTPSAGPVPATIAIDPVLLAATANNDWHKFFRNYHAQHFPNLQPHDTKLLKAQSKCLGHAVVSFAGPFRFFKAVQPSRFMNRPLSKAGVDTMSSMFSDGRKHDWMNPMIIQVNEDDLTTDMKAQIARVDPRVPGTELPCLLRLKPHTAEFLELCCCTWLESDSTTGLYLDQDDLSAKRQRLDEFVPTFPKVKILQGGHRLWATVAEAEKAEQLRGQMVEHGRSGDVDSYCSVKDELEQLIQSATFLVAVYPSECSSLSAWNVAEQLLQWTWH
jgi:hypothetical protein